MLTVGLAQSAGIRVVASQENPFDCIDKALNPSGLDDPLRTRMSLSIDEPVDRSGSLFSNILQPAPTYTGLILSIYPIIPWFARY